MSGYLPICQHLAVRPVALDGPPRDDEHAEHKRDHGQDDRAAEEDQGGSGFRWSGGARPSATKIAGVVRLILDEP